MTSPISFSFPSLNAYSTLPDQALEPLITALTQRDSPSIYSQINQLGNQVPPDLLSWAFIVYIVSDSSDHYDQITTHPHFSQMPANGFGSLGKALIVSICHQESKSLNIIKAHPLFSTINPNGPFGLGEALSRCVQKCSQTIPARDLSYLDAIVNHPAALQITKSFQLISDLGELLLSLAVKSDKDFTDHDEEIVKRLLHQNIAHIIEPNGLFGLGRVLVNAAYAPSPLMVELLLSHPQALYIKSEETSCLQRTSGEQHCHLSRFGFSEAIFATALCAHSRTSILEEDDPLKTLNLLLKFVKEHKIPTKELQN